MKNRRKIFTALLLFIALLLADSRWRIVTSEYSAFSPELPPEFDGFRVIQLSDLHGMEFGKNNRLLVKKVREAEPDIIAITGDLADEGTDMAVVDCLLSYLTDIAPVYYVSGNHEWAAGAIDKLTALFEKYGVRYLRNEHIELERGGENITLAGVEDPNAWRSMPLPEQVLESVDPGSFTLLLAHRNYWAEKYPELNADVVLCGHAHGGIIRLPFFGGVLGTGHEFFPKHVEGMEQVGDYAVIVSRGFSSGIWVPRFLNNPEVVALTLRCGE